MGARLLVLDNAAQVFGGNENDRSQVTQFMNKLSGLAQRMCGAIVLCGHPSKSAAFSGSTAWEAVARSRLDLTRPTPDDIDPVDMDVRVLARAKANYAGMGDEIRVRFTNGAFAAEGVSVGVLDHIQKLRDDEVFISALRECVARNLSLSDSKHADNFAPRKIVQLSFNDGVPIERLTRAMSRLIASRDVVVQPPGMGRRSPRLVVREVADDD